MVMASSRFANAVTWSLLHVNYNVEFMFMKEYTGCIPKVIRQRDNRRSEANEDIHILIDRIVHFHV